MFCCFNAVCQVAFTSLVKVASRWILVAVILSIVSLSFIALVHLALISWSVCCTLFLCITRSHLSTQIRWLASDIRICRSLVRPFVFVDATVCSSFCCLPFSGRDICPTLNMVPIVIMGHSCHSRGQCSSAFLHIRSLAFALHSSMMCCIVSTDPSRHVLQNCLCSRPRTSFHLSPIMNALCIALYRNCCILVHRIGRFRLLHIVMVVSWVLLVSLIASFAARIFSITSGHGGLGRFSSIPW